MFELAPLSMTSAETKSAPQWFRDAVSHPRSAHTLISADGTPLHLAGWNEAQHTKPALLLVHGFLGNTHWWDFIAPWLTSTHRVLALDLAGMGASGRRSIYTMEAFARHILCAVEFLASDAPQGHATVVAHSFSGSRLLEACAQAPHLIGHAIVLDSMCTLRGDAPHPHNRVGRPTPYPDRESALARFRLVPDQPHLPWLKTYLGEQSVIEVPRGWTWQFDPALARGMPAKPLEDFAGRLNMRVDLVRGEFSSVLDAPRAALIAALLPRCRGPIEIPQAHHHLMLDEPLALVATLRSLLA